MRWLRQWFSLVWGVFAFLSICIGLIADLPSLVAALEGRMSSVVLTSAALGGAVYCVGVLGTWLVKWVVYRRNDGPSVDRFRGLAGDIGVCRDRMQQHYERQGSATLGPFETTVENTVYLMEYASLLDRLKSLCIPIPEYARYPETTQRGERFWVAYLTALESAAKEGNLRRARSSGLMQSLWNTATGLGESNDDA